MTISHRQLSTPREARAAADPVIELNDLSPLGNYSLLEVSEPAVFAARHPQYAVRVPIEIWEVAARTGETTFENTAYWQQAISALGIDATKPAVVYDDGRITDAARVWFILQYFGVEAYVLNGGFPVLAVLDGEFLVRPVRPGKFVARPGSGPVGLVDRHLLKADLGAGSQILDARTAAEFIGVELRNNARGGHLPGATLLPHSDLIAAGRIKSARELADIFGGTGFAPDGRLVTHCDGGGRAALAALAALRAGYNDVKAYYLSFADWAKDESCPIDTAPERTLAAFRAADAPAGPPASKV